MTKPIRVTALVFVALVFAACGGQSGMSPQASDSSRNAPDSTRKVIAASTPDLHHYVIQTPASGSDYIGVYNPWESNATSATTYFGQQFALEDQYRGLFAGTIGSVTAGTLSQINSGAFATKFGAWYTSSEVPVIAINCNSSLGITYDDIAAGKYDTQLAQDAAGVKGLTSTSIDPAGHGYVMLRLFYEMNASLGDPAGDPNDNNCFVSTESLTKQESEFVLAWQHIFTLFIGDGATNATWVWNPATGPACSNCDSGTLTALYPTTGYVDWVGPDTYDKTGNGIAGTFGSSNPKINNSTYFPTLSKPIITPETGECAQGTDTQGNTANCNGQTGNPTQKSYLTALQTALGTGGLVQDWSGMIYFNSYPSNYDWIFDSNGETQYLTLTKALNTTVGTNVQWQL